MYYIKNKPSESKLNCDVFFMNWKDFFYLAFVERQVLQITMGNINFVCGRGGTDRSYLKMSRVFCSFYNMQSINIILNSN